MDEALKPEQPTFKIPVLQNNKSIDHTLKGIENFYNNTLPMNIGKYFSWVKIQGFRAHFSKHSEIYAVPNTYVNMSDYGLKLPLGKNKYVIML